MAADNTNELVFLPLGGVGEIGMNLALYGYGPRYDKTWIVVDFGISFAHDDLPGVDVVLPDIGYLEEERANVAGIFLTHAHEDHYGALVDLWPRLELPVYATKFSAGLLAAKVAGQAGAPHISVEIVRPGKRIKAGPFELEYVNVAHSIPESNAIVIRSPAGTVVHSGDYKLDPEPALGDPTDEKRLREIGEEGVLALISDSTNAMREGESPTETAVGNELAEIIAASKGRVAVTTFASNVGRVLSVARAAAASGRQLVVAGRAFRRSIEVARECGMLGEMGPVLTEDVFHSLPRDKVVVLMTGSQGEPRAAVARVAADEHPRISLTAGDTFVFSARAIPGNERAIYDHLNAFAEMGVHIIRDTDRPVHVSGHPRRDEMRQLYRWLKPDVAVPVHGEAMHLLAHADLAREEGVKSVLRLRDGALARLAPGKPEIVDHVELDPLYRDGEIIGHIDQIGVAERRRLGFVGHVAVSISVDEKGTLLNEPQFKSLGLPLEDRHGNSMDDIVYDAIATTVESLPRPRRRDSGALAESIRRAVRNTVDQAWGKKPVCSVMVHSVEDGR